VSPSDTCATRRDSFVIISCTIHSSGDTLIHIISHIHTHSHKPRACTHIHTHTHTHHYLYIINSL